MIPLADMHCHLLAGLDDGPRTASDALEMCRLACGEGTRLMAATAHQNEQYPDVTPERIRQATEALRAELRQAEIPVDVFPCAEVMARPGMDTALAAGELLSVADRGRYLLVEMPHGLFVDLRPVAQRLEACGVRLILAHPERQPELLHEAGELEKLIALGCLVQVSSASVTQPGRPSDEKALKSWFQRGCVHLMGSDGHSLRRRPPHLAEAYSIVSRWIGSSQTDRIFSTHGVAVAHGLPLQLAAPQPPRRSWFAGWV
jgi:protein-tyrosine phosphatase